MAAGHAGIPIRLDYEDKGANIHTDKINCAIKSLARTITRTRLKDRIRSDNLLHISSIHGLNEMAVSTTATMV